MIEKTADQINGDVLRPLFETSGRFYVAVLFLGVLIVAALAAFGYQVYAGIGVAGIHRPVFWGVYVATFVFWIGIAHAGALLSAVLRLANASWRRPVTRCAEAGAVFALAVGALFFIINLGRPWLFYWLLPYPSERKIWPNFRSPLLWDLFALCTCFIASSIFLLLPILPDWALARDRARGWRKRLYAIMALGWRGTPRQWRRLQAALRIVAILIIPIAISVPSIVAWNFALTPVPMWHSTIFAPYFVAGAVFSGVAALILAMAFLRKALRLEAYFQPVHFDYLGKLLLVLGLLWLYFIFAERLTAWYGNESSVMAVFWLVHRGPYVTLFWTMMACNVVIPFPLLALRKLRTIAGTTLASAGIVVGMWIERFLIIVPPLARQHLPYSWGTYRPTWVEITIVMGSFATMALLYLLFSKFVPMISIWELKIGLRKTSLASSQLSAAKDELQWSAHDTSSQTRLPVTTDK